MTPAEPSTLLVVEDDQATRTFLVDELRADGYDVLATGRVAEARELLDRSFPDLVVLDVGLPDGSGLDLVRAVRGAAQRGSRVDPQTPMLVLSGRGGELDRVRGLERGADDYLAKPFSYPELRLRVAGLLRRAQARPRASVLQVGALQVDPAAREAHLGGERLQLSQKEFSLLRVLAGDPRRVFTKDELMRQVWGYALTGSTRTLDSHACRLRLKLAERGGRFVVNVWGVGYRLVDDEVAA